jgi:hypothetical protein
MVGREEVSDTIAQTLQRLASGMRRGVGSTFYATRAEALQAEIVEPIAAGDVDDVYAEYDIDALADVVLGWPHERWRCQVSDEDFWILVEAARRGDKE